MVIDNEGGSTKGHDPNELPSNSNSNSTSNSSSSARYNKKSSWMGSLSRPKGRRRAMYDQRFSAYLSFGVQGTIGLALFFLCYGVVLLCSFPLLVQESPKVVPTHRGEVLRPVVEQMKEQAAHFHPIQVAGAAVSVAVGGSAVQHIAENLASSIQHQIQKFRQSEGMTDISLMRQAATDIENIRKHRRQQQQQQQQKIQPLKANSEKQPKVSIGQVKNGSNEKPVAGVVVLGMHRSGTSMLSGLLAIGMGYKTGGPLIGSAFDNKKGFFELVPAVLQNDEFMNKQRIWWSSGVLEYDYQKALDDKQSGRISFKEGERALSVLNSPDKIPFLQKDPRMCITLKTWLPLLNSQPAVLFTYRHPLEVAQSLQRRENDFTLEHGLRLWIFYNMRAVQNSANLCRVTTSNEALLAHPRAEVNRTSYELTTKCRVPPPPNPIISQEDVDKFVDSGLQHAGAQQKAASANRRILASHNNGKCHVYEFESDYTQAKQPDDYAQELETYLQAMKIYCDFESGEAYKPHYQWPELK